MTSTPSSAYGGFPIDRKRIIVGVAAAAVSNDASAVIVTHALGSCLGVAIYDPVARVAGIFHPMLPSASVSPGRAKENPFSCVDSGFSAFMAKLTKLGAIKERMVVKVAGGGQMYSTGNADFFDIGRRNFNSLRKILWAEKMLIKAESVGGTKPQTLFLHVADGSTIISIEGKAHSL